MMIGETIFSNTSKISESLPSGNGGKHDNSDIFEDNICKSPKSVIFFEYYFQKYLESKVSI